MPKDMDIVLEEVLHLRALLHGEAFAPLEEIKGETMNTEKIKDSPILMSGPMVRGIIEGRKTQTRRIMKPQPWYGSRVPGGPHFIWPPGSGQRFDAIDGDGPTYEFGPREQERFALACPYGQVGSRLWVRESFAMPPSEDARGAYKSLFVTVIYKADGQYEGPWTPSIFMRRAASRLTLEITRIRIQRLQAISIEDVRAEGIPELYDQSIKDRFPELEGHHWDNKRFDEQWAYCWDSINRRRAPYKSNPWVWAIDFIPVNVRKGTIE